MMRRTLRFVSTALASLSLALIVLAAASGGEAKADLPSIFDCGQLVESYDAETHVYLGLVCDGWCIFNVSCENPFAPFGSPGTVCKCRYL